MVIIMSILEKISLIIMIGIFMGYILNLVRKNVLRVEYSIPWVFISAVIVFFSLLFSKILMFQKLVSGKTELMIVLMSILILSLVFIVIELSISVSKLKTEVKELVQELSIIKFERDMNTSHELYKKK